MDIKEAVRISVLQDWLNNDYLDINKIKQLRKAFSGAKPFQCLELHDFLKEDKAQELLQALGEQSFYQKDSDLFKFSQTDDFTGTQNKTLKGFRSLLISEEFNSFMSSITGTKLKKNVVDCNGSMYKDTDFLLCHDDQLKGRKIAFIYYLSTLHVDEGGRLFLYFSKKREPFKVGKAVTPQYNTFTFFKVSPLSFHEVEEVVSDKDRITINGWFHG